MAFGHPHPSPAFFSEAMRKGSINEDTFKLFDANTNTRIDALVSYETTTKKAVMNPGASLQPGKTYKAVVTTGAKDKAGNSLDQDPSNGGQSKIWFFTVSN